MRALLLLLVGGGVALDQNHPNLEEVGHLSSERSDQVQERSRRQLDFDGGGGGVNDYVNGELDFVSGDFEADQGDGDSADEQDFWRTVSNISCIISKKNATYSLYSVFICLSKRNIT